MDIITTSIQTDAQLKQEADRLFADLGMDFSTAVNVFLRQAVREQGLPFRPTLDASGEQASDAARVANGAGADEGVTVDELYADLEARR